MKWISKISVIIIIFILPNIVLILLTKLGVAIDNSYPYKVVFLLFIIVLLLLFMLKLNLIQLIFFRQQINNFKLYFFPFILIVGLFLLNIDWHLDCSFNIILKALSICLLVAMSEEFGFRIIVQSVLIEQFNVTKGVVLAALIFALMHFLNLISSFNSYWAIVNQVILAYSVGLIFGTLFFKTRNIYPVIILHMLLNINSEIKDYEPYLIDKNNLATDSIGDNIISVLLLLILGLLITKICIHFLQKSLVDQ